jgi:hypothetical protein
MRRGFLYLVAVMDWAELPKVPRAQRVEWQRREHARCCPSGCRTPRRWSSVWRRWEEALARFAGSARLPRCIPEISSIGYAIKIRF